MLLTQSIIPPSKGGPTYSVRHRFERLIWGAIWLLLCAWTPAPLHRWRIWVLNLFGAKVDTSAHVYGSARIWHPKNLRMAAHSCLGPGVICYCMATVELGQGAIVSQGAHLCAGTHNIDHPDFLLETRPIFIGSEAWVAAEAFIGPGVTIGERAVVGARAVIFRDAEPNGVYIGNPAKFVRYRETEDG